MQTIISNFLKDRKVFCIKDKYGFYIDCPFCKHRASSNEVQIYSNGDFFCKKCDVAYNWEDFCKQIYELNYGNIRRNFKQEYLDAVESKKKGAAKLVTYEFSKHLIEEFNIKTIRSPKNFEMFIYKEGVYVDGYNIIREAIRIELEEFASKDYINEILETIKDKSTVERNQFQIKKELINLKNGTYDLSQNELLPHSPENLFLSKLNVTYDLNADCVNIKAFLSEMLGEEYVPIVQELFGYLVYRSHAIKKAFILVGVPNTGKTTFIKIIYRFLGVDNVTSIDLQSLSQGRFGTSSLYTKSANIYDDLSSDDIAGTGIFKMLTGDGPVSGEKKYGDRFVFMNYAKLIFACNKIPQIKDIDDPAYFERWIVFPFENQINKEKKDIKLTEKLIAEEEMSGLFNFALEGLTRLIKNGAFSYIKEWEEIKEEMTCSGNPVAGFVYEVLEKSEEDFVTKQEMYSVFSSYRIAKKLPYRSEKSVGYSLPRVATYISSGKPVSRDGNGKQVTAWMGVKIKDEFKHLMQSKATNNELEEFPSYEELTEIETAEPPNLGF